MKETITVNDNHISCGDNMDNYKKRPYRKRRKNPYKMAYKMMFKVFNRLFYMGIVIALIIWLFKLI